MRMKKKNRNIELISAGLGILIVIIFIFLNNIILLAPYGIVYDRTPKLAWSGFDKEYRLLVDENYDFDNPIIDVLVNENQFNINKELDFGEYYWKVISNDQESITGYFTIDSMIQIELNKKLRNKGNTPVLISGITGRSVLDIGEEIDVKQGENYTIKQT